MALLERQSHFMIVWYHAYRVNNCNQPETAVHPKMVFRAVFYGSHRHCQG